MKKLLILFALAACTTDDVEIVMPDPVPPCTPVPHETCGLAPSRPGYTVELLEGQARLSEEQWDELDAWIHDTAAWRDCVEGRR